MYIIHICMQDKDGGRQTTQRHECREFPIIDRQSLMIELNTVEMGRVSYAKEWTVFLNIILGAD